jgi:flagellar assembly protein FliH
MSSSAPKRQPSPETFIFAYADAGMAGISPEVGQSETENSRRQQAEFFEQGRQSAQQQFSSDLETAVSHHHEQIGDSLRQFASERQAYYRRVESEVVELALAVARKILHREVQIDPQALAGIVRVTLEKLDIGTKVNLRVHPREAGDWRHYFACQTDDGPSPDVHEDSSVAPGECRIETSLGSTEIGLRLQLKEIETGLLDLLAARPDSASPSLAAETSNAPPPAFPTPASSTASPVAETR